MSNGMANYKMAELEGNLNTMLRIKLVMKRFVKELEQSKTIS